MLAIITATYFNFLELRIILFSTWTVCRTVQQVISMQHTSVSESFSFCIFSLTFISNTCSISASIFFIFCTCSRLSSSIASNGLLRHRYTCAPAAMHVCPDDLPIHSWGTRRIRTDNKVYCVGTHHPVYGALSKQGLLGSIKPAYSQSRPDGHLKLTARAFNRPCISILADLVTVPIVTQNSKQSHRSNGENC